MRCRQPGGVLARPYGVIAFTPSAPAMAVATVMMIFRMVFKVSLVIFMMIGVLVLPPVSPRGQDRGRARRSATVPDLRLPAGCSLLAPQQERGEKKVISD